MENDLARKCDSITAEVPRKGLMGRQKIKMHINSSQVESVLNPVRGIRDAQKRQGITPVNHSRHNKDAIKQMSEMNCMRKLNFDDGITKKLIKPVPKPSNCDQAKSKPNSINRDFISDNIVGAGTQKPVNKPGKSADKSKRWLDKDGYGQIPKYLLNRKMELANVHAAQQAAREAAMLPPGMKIMPEVEQKEALHMLAKNKIEVEAQLQGLPLVVESPGLVNTKASLEKRLREIEEAEKIFSRPKVLVKA